MGFFKQSASLLNVTIFLYIFLTNHPTLIQSCEVLPGISDHKVVHVVSSVLVSYCRPKPRRILLWHIADFEIIKSSQALLQESNLTLATTISKWQVQEAGKKQREQA